MNTPTTSWDEQTRKIVFATVAKDVRNPADQKHFEHLCVSKGLDPLAKEIWCVARGGKPTFMLSIDGFLKLANSTQQLDGLEIEFFDKEGNGSEVWLKDSAPAACVARAYRKGCSRPFTASARFAAYNGNSPLWKKLPEVMLSKVATTLALRRGFSDVLSGLHSPEEMDQSGLVPEEAMASTPSAAPAAAPAPAAEEVKPEPKKAKPKPAPEAKAKPVEEAAASLAAVTDGAVSAPSAPVEEKVEPAGLPEREDLTGGVGALYKQARLRGLSVNGWASLEKQCGGEISPALAAKLLKAGVLNDPEKVAHLDAGRKSTGEAL